MTIRKWLQRVTSGAYYQPRQQSCQESHPICSSSAMDIRKAQSAILKSFQMAHGMGSVRHASVPSYAKLQRRDGLLQL